jgi:hypothetical protein
MGIETSMQRIPRGVYWLVPASNTKVGTASNPKTVKVSNPKGTIPDKETSMEKGGRRIASVALMLASIFVVPAVIAGLEM